MTLQEQIKMEKKQDLERSTSAIRVSYEITPPEYHSFIYLIEQRKNYAKGENAPKDYMAVAMPYMSVDGRIAMIKDEHKKEGKKYKIHKPEYDTAQMLCSVLVESEIRGEAWGCIEMGKDYKTKGIKYADAQTSAVGRALGFLGYGILPSGVASAEEIINYLERQIDNGGDDRPKAQQSPPPQNKQGNGNGKPALKHGTITEEQVEAIKSFMGELKMNPNSLLLICNREFNFKTAEGKAIQQASIELSKEQAEQVLEKLNGMAIEAAKQKEAV